jgi:hypothetical protein
MVLWWLLAAFCFLCAFGQIPATVSAHASWPVLCAVGALFMISMWGIFRTSYPSSARGYPTDPPGVWVNSDTLLEIGMSVLAQWEGQWWRAVILGFEPKDGVLVRYVDWGREWDEVHRRTSLQLPEYGDGPAAVADSPPVETAIRVDVRDKIQ